jgi:ERCC4-type nuclease
MNDMKIIGFMLLEKKLKTGKKKEYEIIFQFDGINYEIYQNIKIKMSSLKNIVKYIEKNLMQTF